MPIQVSCPSCGGRFRAPDNAAGRNVKCPSCATLLTIPGGAVPQAVQPAARPTKECSYCGEEVAVNAKVCKHCGRTIDVVLDAAERAERAARSSQQGPNIVVTATGGGGGAASSSASSRSGGGYRERPPGDPAGMTSLVLGIISVVCLFVTCGSCGFVPAYALAIPMSLIGLLVGFFGRGGNRIFGLILNGLTLLPSIVLVVLILAFGTAFLSSLKFTPTTGPTVTDSGTDKDKGSAVPSDWTDASKDTARDGDLKISIPKVEVAGVKLDKGGRQSVTPQKQLQVTVRIMNAGQAPATYTTWNTIGLIDPKAEPVLKDSAGRSVRLAQYPDPVTNGMVVGGLGSGAVVNPGETKEDILLFEVPSQDVKYLRLELPELALTRAGPAKLKFQIPASMIRR